MFYDFEESFVIIGLNNIYSTDLIQWFYELLWEKNMTSVYKILHLP